jgi:site-specific DNA recombinase
VARKRDAPLRVGGYVRISALMGRVQGDDLMSDSIQRERIEAWAQFQGAHVVGWYEDIDRSGRKGKARPEFERLMQDARSGALDAIAVYRWSRLGRHAAGALAVLDELDELGVRLVSVEESIDTSTPMGRFIRLVLVGLAEYQSEGISDEWRAKYAADRRAGIALQRRTLGFRRELREDGSEGARIAGVEPREAEAVRLMFEWYADGMGKTSIARRLDNAGFQPVQGARFTASTVDTVLRNPTYCGLIRYTDKHGTVEEFEAAHEAIVQRELWEKVQRERRRRATTPPPRTRAALLSGLIRCAGCGYPMNHDRRGEVAYYRCAARNRGTACDLNTSVRADFVDSHVWDAFEGMVAALFLSRGRDAVGDPADAESVEVAAQAQACRERAAELQAKLDQLTIMSDVLGSQYQRQAAFLVEQIDEALEEADAYESRVRRRTERRWAELEGWCAAETLP